MYFKQKYRIAVWAVSTSVGAFIVFIPFLQGVYTPLEPYIIPLSQSVNNSMAFGLVIALLFPAVVEYNNYTWGRKVDKNIPKLLRDLTEAVRSGVTLPRALEEASQRDYGPISKELERAMATFILGVSWEESLISLAHSLRRPSALRFCSILVEAQQTGGKIVDVLESSVDLFSSLDEYKEESYAQMRPYVMIVYMATLVFLIVAYVVLHRFLTPLAEASSSPSMQGSSFLGGVLDIKYYRSILFWASIMESILGGLVAGKIGDGASMAGLRHSIILSIITLLFFNILSF